MIILSKKRLLQIIMGGKLSELRPQLEQHFTYVVNADCYKCNLCPKLMKGIKKCNFVRSTKDHLNRMHPGTIQEEKCSSSKQMKLSADGNAVSSSFKKRKE